MLMRKRIKAVKNVGNLYHSALEPLMMPLKPEKFKTSYPYQ